jgi:carbamoyl-phosphate synthase large subunit
MEHIEEAGVHSGDSACAIPPQTLSPDALDVIGRHTAALAGALDVRGLLNVQYAVKDGEVYVIEANPRASRTVPFVSKATGVPLAKVAARVMAGATLAELRTEGLLRPPSDAGHVAVKEAVLPFNRFPTVDTLLGPEMRSTGEVMGIDRSFGLAFAKSQAGAGSPLPTTGTVFLSLADRDKPGGLLAARRFAELGFTLVATAGTAAALRAEGLAVATVVAKVGDDRAGDGADAVDLIAQGAVDLVVNTPRGRGPRADGDHIRRAAIRHQVACITTVAAALAAVAGIAEQLANEPIVRSLQDYHDDRQMRLGV